MIKILNVILTIALLSFNLVGIANSSIMLYSNIGGDSSTVDIATVDTGIPTSTDNFEDLPSGLQDYGQFLPRTAYDITSSTHSLGKSIRSTDANSIEGNISMVLINDTDPVTFSFHQAISSFAITFNDIDLDFGGVFNVSIDGNSAITLLGPDNNTDIKYFLGIIDTEKPFSSITFDRTVGDGYYFDLVRYGYGFNPIPEPATVLLLGLGLVGIIARKRRS